MGMTRIQWASSFLQYLGAPYLWLEKEGRRNRQALVAWEAAEGTWAVYNPLSCVRVMPGSTNFNTLSDGEHVQNYPDLETGFLATFLDLTDPTQPTHKPVYTDIMAGARPTLYTLVDLSKTNWGTGGLALQIFDDVLAHWHTYSRHGIGT